LNLKHTAPLASLGPLSYYDNTSAITRINGRIYVLPSRPLKIQKKMEDLIYPSASQK
jgi:hypothetical protein